LKFLSVFFNYTLIVLKIMVRMNKVIQYMLDQEKVKKMGSLRVEPKRKAPVSTREYRSYQTILKDAMGAATGNHVYFDMEASENPNKLRKVFLHVAEKEGIPVTIRRARGSHSLMFLFKPSEKRSSSRMSAEECRHRIMNALSRAKRALQKSEIINLTGISASTWNVRIKELMTAGKVARHGDRRDTKYSLIA